MGSVTKAMKLKKFRVTTFRSVEDSHWIEMDDVGCLIGINESGKSNLLTPLWKLNPAVAGAIHPLSDMPRNQYNMLRDAEEKPVFVEAHFVLSDDLARKVASLTGAEIEEIRTVSVSRDFDGNDFVAFPEARSTRQLGIEVVQGVLSKAGEAIGGMAASVKAEEGIKGAMLGAIDAAVKSLVDLGEEVDADGLGSLLETLEAVNVSGVGSRSTIGPRFGQAVDQLKEMQSQVSMPHPNESDAATALVLEHLPQFVYYSNYGNLDSEIYLPHVIDNMERKDLGSKEAAKARTLKVLFDFVRLKPKEILELGKEPEGLNKDQLEKVAEKKRERDVLLQSASARLTKEFREWWKQGDYRFRFQADGNHFRIWVSDDKRPEDIELENRSTGLQWFLSFFLVFLVEAKDSHEDAVLLLDEPGLTLHPLAQKDLAVFFDNLAKTNQLIFSTHSPFMLEADKLDRVRAVYLDENGRTVVSANLRAAAPHSVQAKSIFAAHAALGLTVSDVLLQGCQPVIVEGVSDQNYLSAIKTYLIGTGALSPAREIVFVPAGGIKGIKAVASVLASKEEELPYVLLDSDQAGKGLASALRSDLYRAHKDRVILIGELLESNLSLEVEDLMPRSIVVEAFSREYRGKDAEFSDAPLGDGPLVPQMEAFAKANGINLRDGWKVELAQAVKRRALAAPSALERQPDRVEVWKSLFGRVVASQIRGLTRSTQTPGSTPASAAVNKRA